MVRKLRRKSRKKTKRKPSDVSWGKVPSTGVLIITGHRGQGKSALAWWLADYMREKTNKSVAALGVPKLAQKLFPKRGFGRGGIKFVDKLEQVSKLKPSIVICDEAAFLAGARDGMSKNNKDWLKLIAICRHKDHLLVFVHQQSRQLDVQIMIDSDLVLMKRPTQLHLRGARSEFAPELKEAYEKFSRMRSDTRKKVYAVDYHYGKRAMLNAEMPSWWSEKISRAYEAVDIK